MAEAPHRHLLEPHSASHYTLLGDCLSQDPRNPFHCHRGHVMPPTSPNRRRWFTHPRPAGDLPTIVERACNIRILRVDQPSQRLDVPLPRPPCQLLTLTLEVDVPTSWFPSLLLTEPPSHISVKSLRHLQSQSYYLSQGLMKVHQACSSSLRCTHLAFDHQFAGYVDDDVGVLNLGELPALTHLEVRYALLSASPRHSSYMVRSNIIHSSEVSITHRQIHHLPPPRDPDHGALPGCIRCAYEHMALRGR
ncbi:hypothetical protein BKA70DRAFT_747683 [Coprinopsis sp. MPI-PUGE-AT-0042]|nr:hypothetical protein BKA70DRAFT_747683 [Coprinopsis sp. MPI-PUGE-AT-0042]